MYGDDTTLVLLLTLKKNPRYTYIFPRLWRDVGFGINLLIKSGKSSGYITYTYSLILNCLCSSGYFKVSIIAWISYNPLESFHNPLEVS